MRTPRSTRRRARRQPFAKGEVPYSARTEAGSPRISKALMASDCMRKAVSMAWMRRFEKFVSADGLLVVVVELLHEVQLPALGLGG